MSVCCALLVCRVSYPIECKICRELVSTNKLGVNKKRRKRACANSWGLFRHKQSRGGRGRRATVFLVALLLCFGWPCWRVFGLWCSCCCVFLKAAAFHRFFASNKAYCKYEALLPHLYHSVTVAAWVLPSWAARRILLFLLFVPLTLGSTVV